MKRFLSSVALAASLLIPVTVLQAQDHKWNDNENPAWHQYLKDHHKKDHDWSKASKREQNDYWKWRDQHRDAH